MIRWLLATDNACDLDGVLHPRETLEGKRYRHPGRHRQFQFGRVTAKRLLNCEQDWHATRGNAPALEDASPYVPDAPSLFSQRSSDRLPVLGPKGVWIHRTEAGWPQVFDGLGQPMPISLSIAHTGRLALCAMGPENQGRLGVDLEIVAPRSEVFFEDFYTDYERQQLKQVTPAARDRLATIFWTIKEAVLKARQTGLHEDAKSVEIRQLENFQEDDSALIENAENWKQAEVTLKDSSQPTVFWRFAPDSSIAMAIVRT